MSYRIELSPNNRAGCQDKVCKDSGVKCLKGELRFGTWFELPDTGHGSWRWKHWGCVSGQQIENMQNKIKKGDGYEWDMIDGYDELGDHPDLQAKIQRVVEQGHIDAEDFNGDRDYNVPGQRAIRGRPKKAQAGGDEDKEEKATPVKKQATKRGRKKTADSDEEPEPPKKKAKKPAASKNSKAKAKAKVESDDEEEVPKAKAAPKKGRSKKAKPDSEDEEDKAPTPAPKPSKKTAAKGTRGKAAPKASKRAPTPTPESDEDETEFNDSEETEEESEPETESESEPEPPKKVRGKATGRKGGRGKRA